LIWKKIVIFENHAVFSSVVV